MHFYSKQARKQRSERGRRMARARWDNDKTRQPSADDLHLRALDARRGAVFAEFSHVNSVTERATSITLRHSINGRSDQFEVAINGKKLTKEYGITAFFNLWKKSLINGRKLNLI